MGCQPVYHPLHPPHPLTMSCAHPVYCPPHRANISPHASNLTLHHWRLLTVSCQGSVRAPSPVLHCPYLANSHSTHHSGLMPTFSHQQRTFDKITWDTHKHTQVANSLLVQLTHMPPTSKMSTRERNYQFMTSGH